MTGRRQRFLYGIQKAVQHLSYLDRLRAERDELWIRDQLEISREKQVILELGRGVQGDSEKPRKILAAFLSASFHDVRRD